MEYFVRVIDAIAWPSAIVWLGYLFRREVRQLLGRMSTLKYKDMEAKFEKELLKAETEAKKITTNGGKTWEETTARAVTTQFEQFQRIAEVSPRAAILESWLDVEVAIMAAAEKAGLEVKVPVNTNQLAMYLFSMEVINNEVVPVYQSLKNMRNQAAHMADFTLSYEEAIKYLDLALGVANTFRRYATSSHNKIIQPTSKSLSGSDVS